MIRYSHVRLMIMCREASDETYITDHLGVAASRIATAQGVQLQPDKSYASVTSRSWVFESPLADRDVSDRLAALADAIEPFAHKLLTLDSRLRPWIDVVYHNTPQHPHGITGEFHWFRMPVDIMRRF